MSKKEQVKSLVLSGEISKACSIARTFFFGLSDDEKESVEIAADAANSGKKAFYSSIGVDVDFHIANASIILFQKYCL